MPDLAHETTRRRLRPEVVEALTVTPLPDRVDLEYLAHVHHVQPRMNTLTDDILVVTWTLRLTTGEHVYHDTPMPSQTWHAIQWAGFWRSGHEPVPGLSPVIWDDFAANETEAHGLGRFELADVALARIPRPRGEPDRRARPYP